MSHHVFFEKYNHLNQTSIIFGVPEFQQLSEVVKFQGESFGELAHYLLRLQSSKMACNRFELELYYSFNVELESMLFSDVTLTHLTQVVPDFFVAGNSNS